MLVLFHIGSSSLRCVRPFIVCIEDSPWDSVPCLKLWISNVRSFDAGDLRFKSCPKDEAYGNMEAAGNLGTCADKNVGKLGDAPGGAKHVCGGGDGPNDGGRGRSCAAADATSYK